MPTRPSQGGSTGTWGTELDEWLDVSLNSDGTIQTSAVQDALSLDGNAAHYLDGTGAMSVPVAAVGPVTAQVKAFDDATTVSTGDGAVTFLVSANLDGWNLTAAHAYVTTVSSSGLPTVQIRRVRAGTPADMLSTKVTIDANEVSSYTAATAAVVDTSNDDVATGDLLSVDVDVAGTGAKGLGVVLVFEEP